MGIVEFSDQKVGNAGWWWVAGTFVAGLAIYGATTSTAAEEYPSDEARYACEAWVRDELKSPATATFGGTGATGEDGDWTITGTVDAENSFGATLRSTWTCDARVEGDDWVGSATLN